VRRLTAVAMLAAAVVSGVWLDVLASQISGCHDHVCLCATHCPSKASCHETGKPAATRVKPACSHSRGGELPAPLPALLPLPLKLAHLADLGEAAAIGPWYAPEADLRPAPRPPRQTPS